MAVQGGVSLQVTKMAAGEPQGQLTLTCADQKVGVQNWTTPWFEIPPHCTAAVTLLFEQPVAVPLKVTVAVVAEVATLEIEFGSIVIVHMSLPKIQFIL